jgi:hypothetical protein
MKLQKVRDTATNNSVWLTAALGSQAGGSPRGPKKVGGKNQMASLWGPARPCDLEDHFLTPPGRQEVWLWGRRCRACIKPGPPGLRSH